MAGRDVFIIDGKAGVNSHLGKDKPYPRVAAATNKAGNIRKANCCRWETTSLQRRGDDKPLTHGLTIAELTGIASKLGAYRALNLDGGGSTTLAMAKNKKPRLLNVPIHTKLPMGERPVANHLGFYADKL